MKLNTLFLTLAILAPALGQAYPVIDLALPTGLFPIKVFKDYENPNVYWYIPISIDPWTRDNRYRSSLYSKDDTLSFVFRGQPSVEDKILKNVAQSLGTTVSHLAPISYEYSKDFRCQNIFAEDPHVQWIWPNQMGNYLEVVPVSLRISHSAEIVEEAKYHIEHGGLACQVLVGFKAVSTGYK